MAHYRLYLLDNNNRIIAGADSEAIDDAAACVLAGSGLDSTAIVEVWCGVRCVGQVAGNGCDV